MEAKDGSIDSDFQGTYTKVVESECIEYSMEDGRRVTVLFAEHDGDVAIRETFDAETLHECRNASPKVWQAIFDNFAIYVEAK